MTSRIRRLVTVCTVALGLVGLTTACNPRHVELFSAMTGTPYTVDSARSQCLQLTGDPGNPGGACERLAFEVAIHKAWPWIDDVRRTEGIRSCIAGHESSSQPDPYRAENGGTPGVESRRNSTASGRYQYVNGTWQSQLERAERFYGKEISNAGHAGFADPWMQDAVAAYSIVHENGHPWPYSCAKAFAKR